VGHRAGVRRCPQRPGRRRGPQPRQARRGTSRPFALLVHTLIIIWYARHGHDPADIDDCRASQPWYRTKIEPAFEDMLIKVRRTLIAAAQRLAETLAANTRFVDALVRADAVAHR
jgi:hypothetical protein